jgi:hypothetical protein
MRLRFRGRPLRVRKLTAEEMEWDAADREYKAQSSRELNEAIREHGAATEVYISHGASGDWFIVEPQVGTNESMAGTPITTEMAVDSLLRAGRTVYRLEVVPWFNRTATVGVLAEVSPAPAVIDLSDGGMGVGAPGGTGPAHAKNTRGAGPATGNG